VVVVLGVFGAGAGKPFRDVFTVPGTDSQAAVDVLAKKFPSENLPAAQVVFADRTGTVSTAEVEAAAQKIEKLPQVESVGQPRVSPNGHVALLSVTYSVEVGDISLDAIVDL
jgi:RND superfamily putative drug exporter